MVSCRHTAWRKHWPNFSNSCLQQSLRTSVYVATIHFPYAVACDEQVVVECRARRFNGLVDCCVDCMVLEKPAWSHVDVTSSKHVLNLDFGSWPEPIRVKQPDHAKSLPFGRMCLRPHSLCPLHLLLQPSPRGRHWSVLENQILEPGWSQYMDPDW